jgi:hypothetical protein
VKNPYPFSYANKVAADARLRAFVKLWFNEGDAKNYEKLQANVAAVPGITTLAHRPRITSSLISEEFSPKLSGMRTPSSFLQIRAAIRAYRST